MKKVGEVGLAYKVLRNVDLRRIYLFCGWKGLVQAESYAESSVFESDFFQQYKDFFAGAIQCALLHAQTHACILKAVNEVTIATSMHLSFSTFRLPLSSVALWPLRTPGKDADHRQYLLLNGANALSEDEAISEPEEVAGGVCDQGWDAGGVGGGEGEGGDAG